MINIIYMGALGGGWIDVKASHRIYINDISVTSSTHTSSLSRIVCDNICMIRTKFLPRNVYLS